MNKYINNFIKYITSNECPQHDKAKVIKAIQDKFSLIHDRSVFYCAYFAVRISYTKTRCFSNTILSLSNLQKYDAIPFFVVLVSGIEKNRIFLANTTFLSKISHSSQNLSMINIKGSFNGSDILRTYNNLEKMQNDLCHIRSMQSLPPLHLPPSNEVPDRHQQPILARFHLKSN